MFELKKNDNGIYYLIDYIPFNTRHPERFDEESIHLSERLARYKKEDKTFARDFFTDELKEAIVNFSNDILDERFSEIALFAVPPSKVYKYSAVRYSIDEICNSPEVKSGLMNIRKIHNCSEILKRTKDVVTSHTEGRRAYKVEHILSIDSTECFKNCSDDVAFIILDDITTTGIQMGVSRDILVDYYANEDNIFMLAIGSTIR